MSGLTAIWCGFELYECLLVNNMQFLRLLINCIFYTTAVLLSVCVSYFTSFLFIGEPYKLDFS